MNAWSLETRDANSGGLAHANSSSLTPQTDSLGVPSESVAVSSQIMRVAGTKKSDDLSTPSSLLEPRRAL